MYHVLHFTKTSTAFSALAGAISEAWTKAVKAASDLGLIFSTGTAGTAGTVSYAATGQISVPLVLATFLLVYSSYMIDHLADVGRYDDAIDSERSRTLFRNRRRFMAYGAGAFGLALWLTATQANLAAVLLLLIFPLSVALYGTDGFGRLTRGCLGYRRIKDIPGIKAFYTAFFWGLLMIYALQFLGLERPTLAAFFFGHMGLSAFTNTVYCDLKDLPRDRADGVWTLPLLFGVPRTLRLLHRVNLAALLWLCAFALAERIPQGLLGLALIHVYVAAVLHFGKRRLDAGLLPGAAAIDAELLLWLPCAWLGFALFSI